MIITFGKYKGKMSKEVAIEDPSYFKWAVKNVIFFDPPKEEIALAHQADNNNLRAKFSKEILKLINDRGTKGFDDDEIPF